MSRVIKSITLPRVLVVALVLVFGLLLWSPVSASAQKVLFQDDFESESLAAPVSSLANWTITGSVDVIGDDGAGNTNADEYPGNGLYLDMDGTCGNGTITSPSLTLPAGTYQLSFEIGNNPATSLSDNALTVSLGGLFSESFTAPLALTLKTRTFVSLTSTTESLVFSETGTGNCGGSILDDVLLTVQNQVTICHKNKNTISVGPKSAAKHIANHGDSLGACS